MVCHRLALSTLLALVFARTAWSISCYRCSSQETFQCAESLASNTDLVAESCDDIYGSQYCVKATGTYEVNAIQCYRCDVFQSNACSENFDDTGLSPQSCDDIFEAMYCVKATGVYKGILGTQRFCSALDLGNYCEYIKREGDNLEYRSCVYTCTTDGCNRSPGNPVASPLLLAISSFASVVFILVIRQ